MRSSRVSRPVRAASRAAIYVRAIEAASAVGLALAVCVIWLSQAFAGAARAEAQELKIDPNDRRQVLLGKKVYDSRCAACHGAKLEGQSDWRIRKPDGRLPAPPHDASGHTWHHSDEQLFLITKEGVSAIVPGYQSEMPAFRDLLNDSEIAAVLAYIKSTWPAEIRARQPGSVRRK